MNRFEEFAAWTDDAAAALEELCASIVEGGTVVAFCRERKLPYSRVALWVADADHRRERVTASAGLRNDYLSDLVIRNLVDFCEVDLADALDANGRFLPLAEMPERVKRAISAFDLGESVDGEVARPFRVKMIDPGRAVDLLGKMRSMFTQKVEVKGELTLEDLLSGGGDDGEV